MLVERKIESEKNEEVKTGIQDQNLIDVSDSLSKLLDGGVLAGLDVIKKTLETAFSPTNYLNATKSLNEEAYRLARSLGVSSQRTRELTVAVADAIPEFVGIGLNVDDAGKAISGLFESLNTNLTIGKDALVDFAATSKVTGVEQKTLAVNFRDVGVGIASIGDKMMQVTKIAQQAGVTVKAVSDAVVSNLDKMNMYNFEGGIKGLAKMAAQASRLGMSMDGVFGVVDKVFNPEGAINMAAALQRLGVTTSDLLDPLRLMDLAQNDPTELQNQMVNMTKEFVRFNKEANQFEILPGAKRRLNEIGVAMGYNNGELQKMAINAANFDAKLRQIRTFNLPINEDTRNLIATMSQINKQGVAEIRIAQVDEKGNMTGEYETRAVSALTANDIQLIEKQQLSTQSSMSDIARDQLDELRKLNTRINEFVTAQRYGMASSNLFSGAYVNSLNTLTKGFENSMFGSKTARTAKTYRSGIDANFSGSLQDILGKSAEQLQDIFKKVYKNLGEQVTTGNVKDMFTDLFKKIQKTYTTPTSNIKDEYLKRFTETKFNTNVNHTGNINYTFTHDFKLSDLTKLPVQMQQLILDLMAKGITETEIQTLFQNSYNKVFNGNNQAKTVKKTP